MNLSRLLRTAVRGTSGMIMGESQIHRLFPQAAPCLLSQAVTYSHPRNIFPFPDAGKQLHTSHLVHAIDVKVPSMGDSITEGSIAAVLRHTGDLVEEDEPILQIETDKVRAKAFSIFNIMHLFGAPDQPKVCVVLSIECMPDRDSCFKKIA